MKKKIVKNSETLTDSDNTLMLLEFFCEKGGHSKLMRNLKKVWKTRKGPSKGGRVWSRDPKSTLFKILQNKEHYY